MSCFKVSGINSFAAGRIAPRAALTAGLIAGLLLAASCGFRPLYEASPDDPGVTRALAQIKVLNVRAEERPYDRLGQKMHNLLLDRLNPDGRPTAPAYTLQARLTVGKTKTGLQITEEATRARLTVRATFRLTDASSGKTLFRGRERSVNSYNIADSEFATLNAESDAAERAVREISDSIKLRLGIFFRHRRG